MNFSAFASPFAGIHPFAAKFSHDAPGVFSSATNMNQDMHNNRYHTNGNNFNQIPTSSTYGQCNYTIKGFSIFPTLSLLFFPLYIILCEVLYTMAMAGISIFNSGFCEPLSYV